MALWARSAFCVTTCIILCASFLGCAHRPMHNPDYMSAAEFDEIAKTILAPVYPLLARQVLLDYRITFGACLDVGGGAGHLAIELARRSGLTVTVLDIDPEAIALARRNIEAADLTDRIEAVEADAAQMPFPDSSFDLIVSRGSFPFWEDKVAGFREVYRVLKPGGIALVGGGFGRYLPAQQRGQIVHALRKRVPGLDVGYIPRFRVAKILHKAGIEDYAILRDAPPDLTCPCQIWIEIHKL